MWSVLTATAFALPDHPCHTMQLMPSATPLVQNVPKAFAGLQVRDIYGLPNELTSAHYVLHWGNSDGGITDLEREQLLDGFEVAWEQQIDVMGHPAPATTDAYLFNVYIGDSGNGAPSAYGAAGWYWTDSYGYPMIVISKDVFFDPDYVDSVSSHEFYHAIQGSTNRYTYEGVSAWYWEATAEWAAIETHPTNPFSGPFVFSYAMLPELPVNFFDYPDSGILEEYYQYGAFLFPLDLSNQYGFEAVRDSWIVPGAEIDPLEVLRANLGDAGADLDELWLDHLGRNTVFDYDQGANYLYNTEYYEAFWPSHRITDTVTGDGGSGRVDGAIAPYRYGAANLLLDNPSAGTLEVRITGDSLGDEGSPATYGARIVRNTGGVYEYLEVPFVDEVGTLDVLDVGDEDEIWLAVGVWTESTDQWDTEQFEFDWSLEVIAVEPPEPVDSGTDPTVDSGTGPTDPGTDPEPDTGTTPGEDEDPPAEDDTGVKAPVSCACDGAGSPAAGWLGFAALALVGRRRRS
ncbi:MAG: DUF6055 domain-containing protein [Myxococcota bacterium]